MTHRLAVLSSATAAVMLAACGGGDSTAPPPPTTGLAFVSQPANATAGVAFAELRVRITDASGNTATTSTLPVTVALAGSGPSGATLRGTLTRNAVAGVATFDDLAIERAGSGYALSASAGGLPAATSATFAVAPGSATALKVSQAPTTAIAGQSLAPAIVVQVEDAFGNVVPNATNAVTLSITPGAGIPGAVIGGTLTRTAQAGVASFNDITIDRSGANYRLVASAGGLTSANTPPFPVQVSVRIVAGASQTGLAGFELGDSVVVMAQDPIGTPLAGLPLTWTASGGAVSSTATFTNAAGRSAVAWRAGDGQQTLTAAGAGTVATTNATGLARASCGFVGTAAQAGYPAPDTTWFRPTTRTLRVAALFVDFPDLPATRSVAQMMTDIINPGVQRLATTSDGRIQLQVVPAAGWARMPETAGAMRWNDFLTHRAYIDTVLNRHDPTYDFSTIDVVWIFRPSRYDPQGISGTMNLKQGDFWALPKRDGQEVRSFITFGGDVHLMNVYTHWPNYGQHIMPHEMGHILGLPDLYAYQSAAGEDGLRYTGGWSWMGWVAPATTWMAAERMHIGVMPATDGLCPPEQPFAAIVTLRPVEETSGLRAIGLRSGPARLTFLEVRERLGLDTVIVTNGVLLYDVDGNARGGYGPIVVREIHPSPPGPERDRFGVKWNAPAVVGDVIALGTPDVTVTVRSRAADGATTVRVVRR